MRQGDTLRFLGGQEDPGVFNPVNTKGNPDRGKLNNYDAVTDPFRIKIGGSYNGRPLAAHYQYAKSSYGYIVKIEQDGESYEMDQERGRYDASLGARHAAGGELPLSNPLFKLFASGHDEDDEAVHETASQGVTDADVGLTDPARRQSGLKERSRRLDAVTKIAGEGARWQAVRALAQAGHLKSSSRFWCPQDPAAADLPTTPIYYITFKTLWGSWGRVFDSKFNITDAVLADKLRTGEWGEGPDSTRKAATKAEMGPDDYACG